MNLAELRTKVYGYLGTTTTDRAYPAATVTSLLNDALAELCDKLPKGYRQRRGIWRPDSGVGHAYTLAVQTTAVASLRTIVTLRTDSYSGPKLRELAYEQLQAWDGLTYAVTGSDEEAVITTGDGVTESIALYAVYEITPDALSADTASPSWLSARFHDIPCLMAAEMAFASGGEGRFPEEYSLKLLDRRADLQSAVRRRSADVMLTREEDGGSGTSESGSGGATVGDAFAYTTGNINTDGSVV